MDIEQLILDLVNDEKATHAEIEFKISEIKSCIRDESVVSGLSSFLTTTAGEHRLNTPHLITQTRRSTPTAVCYHVP